MSPDEALVKALREIRTRVSLDEQCQPSTRDFLDVLAICDEALGTHRASGEGGSPSALRASAPEGIDERALWEVIGTPMRPFRWKLRQVGCSEDNGPSNYFQYWATAQDEADRRNALAPPQADAKAHLARAAHSLAPEGIVVDVTTAELAAEHLDQEADCLRDSCTVGGVWEPNPDEATRLAKLDHDSMRACAANLRAALKGGGQAPVAVTCPGGDGLGREPDECDGRMVERSCRTCDGRGRVPAPVEVVDREKERRAGRTVAALGLSAPVPEQERQA